MGDYLRVTQACDLSSMRPTLAAAIQNYVEKHELGDVTATTLFCGETISTRQKKGLFRNTTEVFLTGILLTSKWLIWAAGKENEPPAVLAARLSMIQVENYETSGMNKLVQDSGINVSGIQTSEGSGTAFIGLGPEAAAQKFRDVLKKAMEAAG